MTGHKIMKAFHAVGILRAIAIGLPDYIVRNSLIRLSDGLMSDVARENVEGISLHKQDIEDLRYYLYERKITDARVISDALYGVAALLVP